MESIFDILYIPMGYLIRLAYSLTDNYLLAILLFTLVMEVILSPFGIKRVKIEERMDTAEEKRVELHCHTQLSQMDAIITPAEIIDTAIRWGHKAIAITDHGAVQSFTDANHVWDDLWKAEKTKRKEAGEENPDKQDFFKIIYGVEGYIVDDLKQTVTQDKGQVLAK